MRQHTQSFDEAPLYSSAFYVFECVNGLLHYNYSFNTGSSVKTTLGWIEQGPTKAIYDHLVFLLREWNKISLEVGNCKPFVVLVSLF